MFKSLVVLFPAAIRIVHTPGKVAEEFDHFIKLANCL